MAPATRCAAIGAAALLALSGPQAATAAALHSRTDAASAAAARRVAKWWWLQQREGGASSPGRRAARKGDVKSGGRPRRRGDGGPAPGRLVERRAVAEEVRHAQAAEEAAALATPPSPAALWTAVALWLRANGAALDEGQYARAGDGGRFRARGLLTRAVANASSALMSVPKRVWIHAENFPEVFAANLTMVPACAAQSRPTLDMLQLAVALALESQKGDLSWYAPYLQQLPTLEDYHAFHPHFAERDVLDEFRAMPLLRLVRHMQEYDNEMKACFEQWQSGVEVVGGPATLVQLAWPAVHVAVMHCRLRRAQFGSDMPPAIVPGADLLNAAGVDAVNVAMSLNEGKDTVDVLASAPVAPGGELLAEYCGKCDNSRLLLLWGVQLPANPVPLEPGGDRTFCSTSPAGSQGGCEAAAALRSAVASLLDLKQGISCPSEHAPDAARNQRPLRCALAKLALEYCAGVWSHEAVLEVSATGQAIVNNDIDGMFSQQAQKGPETSFGGMGLQEVTDAVYASSIGAVHPFLVSAY